MWITAAIIVFGPWYLGAKMGCKRFTIIYGWWLSATFIIYATTFLCLFTQFIFNLEGPAMYNYWHSFDDDAVIRPHLAYEFLSDKSHTLGLKMLTYTHLSMIEAEVLCMLVQFRHWTVMFIIPQLGGLYAFLWVSDAAVGIWKFAFSKD